MTMLRSSVHGLADCTVFNTEMNDFLITAAVINNLFNMLSNTSNIRVDIHFKVHMLEHFELITKLYKTNVCLHKMYINIIAKIIGRTHVRASCYRAHVLK